MSIKRVDMYTSGRRLIVGGSTMQRFLLANCGSTMQCFILRHEMHIGARTEGDVDNNRHLGDAMLVEPLGPNVVCVLFFGRACLRPLARTMDRKDRKTLREA